MEAVAATDPGCEAGKCAGPPLWGGIYMVKRLRFSQIEANFHFSLRAEQIAAEYVSFPELP